MYRKIVLVLLSTVFILSACTQPKQEESKGNQEENILNVKNTENNGDRYEDNKEIANHLADIASSVPSVNKSTAVVAGPYAVVGIDVDKDLDRTRVGTIKNSVNEALHDDAYGKTAVVIADGDIMERLTQMRDKMEQGQPVRGIVDELSAIVGRYMPNFPVQEDLPESPDENKEILPENEKDDLNQIQEEQSNR